MRLKGRYILFTTAILLLTLGVFSFYALRLQEREIQEDEKKKARLISNIVQNSLVTVMLHGNAGEFQKLLETITIGEMEKVWVFGLDGIILSSSSADKIGTRISDEHMEKLKSHMAGEIFLHREGKKTVYSAVTPIYNELLCQKCHNARDRVLGVLDVEISAEKAIQGIHNLRTRILLLSIIILIVISISLSILTTRLVNRPVSSIINVMEKAKKGNLKAKFIPDREDELGQLAASLNSMISELDRAQNEIEKLHADELHTMGKMATLGEMASSIAHEIKNPLAGISGAIQVLAEELQDNDPRKEVITEVLNEIERLDRAVKALLLFAKPPQLHPVVTTPQPIIERAKRLLELQAEKQKVAIELIPEENIPGTRADPEQMQQVFYNIMLNALQAMPSGGTITVHTRFETDRNEIDISFSDTTQGIEDESLKNIFKPFFTTRHTATGLGLAISRNIVEQHGGRIEVESKIGIGTTFHVILNPDKKVQQ